MREHHFQVVRCPRCRKFVTTEDGRLFADHYCGTPNAVVWAIKCGRADNIKLPEDGC